MRQLQCERLALHMMVVGGQLGGKTMRKKGRRCATAGRGGRQGVEGAQRGEGAGRGVQTKRGGPTPGSENPEATHCQRTRTNLPILCPDLYAPFTYGRPVPSSHL